MVPVPTTGPVVLTSTVDAEQQWVQLTSEHVDPDAGILGSQLSDDPLEIQSLDVAADARIWTGQDGGWDDVLGGVWIPATGPNRPAWANWAGSTVFGGPKFALNDELPFELHFKHGTIVGTDVYLHVHWVSDGTDANTVKWEWTYSYARGYGQDHFSATGTTVTAVGTPDGTAYGHYITELSTPVQLATIEPDGIMNCRLRRITNGGTDNADGIFLLKCDAHHRNDRIYTKNKNTPFNT